MKLKWTGSERVGRLIIRRSFLRGVCAVVCGLGVSLALAAPSERVGVELTGIYQVVSSNDPYFSLGNQQEWFLDFGEGMVAGKASGSVAVSLRRNPHVKVRIMAWQFLPERSLLVIGNPYHEGARRAVAAGGWILRMDSKDIVCERDGFQFVLRRAISP